MDFKRNFKDTEALAAHELFSMYLFPDITLPCKRGQPGSDVFPAVRNGSIDFYYGGGKIFTFKSKKFSTHHKFASVLPYTKKNPYVSESMIAQCRPWPSFTQSPDGKPSDFYYERIKENCAGYNAGSEAEAVSYLFGYSCAKQKSKSDIVLIDIEVSFKNRDPATELEVKRHFQDRVDFVLLNRATNTLKFFEAKLIHNDEIKGKSQDPNETCLVDEGPPVLKQLNRYRSQIVGAGLQDIIKEQYANHIRVMQNLFKSSFPDPTKLKIDPEPALYITGFDETHREKLRGYLSVLKEKGIHFYAAGNFKTVNINSLWKAESTIR